MKGIFSKPVGVLVLLFLSVSVTEKLYAQYGLSPGTFNDMAYTALNANLNTITINTGTPGLYKKTKRTEGKPIAGKSIKLEDLSFAPSIVLQNSIIESVAAEMGKGNQSRTQIILSALKSEDAIQKFDDLLKKYGFDPRNMADVLAAYILLNWQIITGNEATQHLKGVYIYRDAMRGAMSANKTVMDWDNRKRQQICQRMALYAFIAGSAGRDEKTLSGINRKVQEICGANVKDYILTDTGFKKQQ